MKNAKKVIVYTRSPLHSIFSRLQVETAFRELANRQVQPANVVFIHLDGNATTESGLQKLIQMVETDLVSAIIVYDVTRLTRNVYELRMIQDLLVKKGVKLIGITNEKTYIA